MKLYNSLTKKLDNFKPLNKNKVLIYVCGITPYDTTHLGHTFLYVFFDSVYRYLQFRGFEVNYTQNVTDVDDSILEKAEQTNQDWKKLGNFWTGKFLKDLGNLNVLRPTHFVKATNSIDKIVEIVKLLIDRGFAYENSGNVYFEIEKFSKYGKLSGFNRQQMLLISSERGGNIKDPGKKDPLDFILWQKSKIAEPSWDSPWSKGRPGWHIECSAMANQYLGAQIDIHGGGRDLIFPHHESEIAESESYTQKFPYSKYWLHSAMLMYQGEKMSKSLGNLIMISDLLKKYTPNSIRFVLLSHHYRSPWEFTFSDLEQAQKNTKTIENRIKNTKIHFDINTSDLQKIIKIIDYDFDFPEALNFLLSLKDKKDAPLLTYLYSILGFII